jgi:hypothetical protein
VFTEEPYWLTEAYEQPINKSDTGLLLRNQKLQRISSTLLYFFFNETFKYLDYAGGYGVFTRLMRDNGFDFYWDDPYTTNLFAQGFEDFKPEKYNLITCFEVYEHYLNPAEETEKILERTDNILLSQLLLPEPIPASDKWWYYGLEHGQHISFYSKETFEYLAKKHNLNFYSYQNIHLLTPKKLNQWVFTNLIKFSGYGIYQYIQKKLKSKTFEDHLLISSQTYKI